MMEFFRKLVPLVCVRATSPASSGAQKRGRTLPRFPGMAEGKRTGASFAAGEGESLALQKKLGSKTPSAERP